MVGVSLLIWLAAGIVSTCGALSYTELGTRIPTSGADFSYMIHVRWWIILRTFPYISNLGIPWRLRLLCVEVLSTIRVSLQFNFRLSAIICYKD